MVVIGIGTIVRRLKSEVAAQIKAAQVVAEAPLASAELETRLERVALSAIHFQVVVVGAAIDASVLGVDIDHALVAISDLRGHHAGQQSQAVHEARTENLAEAGHRLGEEHVIDAILDTAAVFSMNMNLLLSLPVGVLAHARRLLQELRKRRVLSLGKTMNSLLIESISGGADIGSQIVARAIETLGQHPQCQRRFRFHGHDDRLAPPLET